MEFPVIVKTVCQMHHRSGLALVFAFCKENFENLEPALAFGVGPLVSQTKTHARVANTARGAKTQQHVVSLQQVLHG